MRQKKFLLIGFFLALFVFQQAQASSQMSSVTQFPSSVAVLQNYDPPTQIFVHFYHLEENGNPIDPENPASSCDPLNPLGEMRYGCTELPNIYDYKYPYTINPALVNVENDYLLDVISHEMPAQLYPNHAALSSQAVTARSFAYYWNNEGWNVQNSTVHQVAIPYAFEFFLGDYLLNDPQNPCGSTNNRNQNQQKVCDAVTSTTGIYLALHNSDLPAKTEFSADWDTLTVTGDAPNIGVADPISTCGVDKSGSHGRGLDQKGANRWALGNKCATASDGNEPWPVQWSDYRQILVHYYTGIDILDESGGKVAPDDRWNLLWHDIPTQVNSGQTYQVNVWLQNTSTTGWTGGKLGYQWIDFQSNPTAWTEIDIPNTAAGADQHISVSILPPAIGGTYTLRLDVKRTGGNWFSSGGWPDVRIAVTVNGPAATATPTPTSVPGGTSTPIMTPTPTVTPTPATGILTCDTEAGCVNCTDHGSYLDYDININVTGLTGGATAYNIPIGTYKRNTTGGYMGMLSNFVHSERSGDARNWVLSLVSIKPFDAARVDYTSFTGGPGTYVRVKNETSDWRFIGGTGGWPNTLSVRGNVDYAITAYSIYGHIYLYSDPNFTEPFHCFFEASTQMIQLSQAICNNLARIFNQRLLLYRVRDELLNADPEGRRFKDLYYAHSAEIAAILNAHDELMLQGLDVMDALSSNLISLLDGQGDTAIITSAQVQQTQAFLDALMPYASPELQQAITNERTKHPLGNLVGMTINQAKEYLFDITPPTVLSSTLASTNPTKITPVDFTVTFSESVTGVDANDFSLTTTGTLSGAAVASIESVSASVYTVRVNTGTGTGTIRLNVLSNGSIVDLALNPFTGGFFTGQAYTVVGTFTVQSVGTYNGWVLESAETSGVGGTMNRTATTFNLGDDASDKQYVSILHFDTSNLPDTVVIASATLKIKKYSLTGTDPFTILGDLLVDMRKPSFGAVDLAIGDFQAIAGQIAVAAFDPTPVNNWFGALLNSSGRSYINLTGTTQFRLRFATDDNDNHVADYLRFYSGDHGTTSVWPTLVIEYYVQ